jgi:DNA-binding FadR family transcriptional regulator
LHATDADLAHLDAVNARILENQSVDDAARCDFEFHEALVSLASNRTLLTNYRLLQPVITQIMRVGKATKPVQVDTHLAHTQIINALKARDRVAYAYLISRHLEYGLQFVGVESARSAGGD